MIKVGRADVLVHAAQRFRLVPGSRAITIDKRGMRRHRVDACRDHLLNATDQLVQLLVGKLIDHRMIFSRRDVLAQHHLHPAGPRKHFFRMAVEPAAIAEQVL